MHLVSEVPTMAGKLLLPCSVHKMDCALGMNQCGTVKGRPFSVGPLPHWLQNLEGVYLGGRSKPTPSSDPAPSMKGEEPPIPGYS